MVHTLALFLALCAGQTMAQRDTSFTGSPTSTITSSLNTPAPSNAWAVPLVGPPAAPGPWGANGTQVGHPTTTIIPVALGSSSSGTAVTLADPIAPTDHSQKLVAPAPSLVLGTDSNLIVQGPDSNQSLPTLPFGLTLGREGHWNGSLVLGGSYDQNRIFQQRWAPVPETTADTTFLSNGTQSVGTIGIRRWTYLGDADLGISSTIQPATPFGNSRAQDVTSLDAILDFSSEKLVLPSPDFCGRNISLQFNVGVNSEGQFLRFDVPISGDLTASPSRCSGDAERTIVLGIPFFQSAYLYVDEDEKIYFSAANRFDLPPKVVPFKVDDYLAVPSQPPSPTQSTAPSPTNSANRRITSRGLLMLFSLVSFALML
ncbi:hypothetical protein N7512_003179 [Penicillium capsulatum]|nr:hypothetical protein N7512_003179 [Penicillium capsulatum]